MNRQKQFLELFRIREDIGSQRRKESEISWHCPFKTRIENLMATYLPNYYSCPSISTAVVLFPTDPDLQQQFFVLIRPKKYSQNFNEIFNMGYNLGRGHNFQKF